MARWLVNRNDIQLVADSMAELQGWAQEGKLGPGDLIQPPGANDWLYAGEIAELASHMMSGASAYDDDLDMPKRGGGLGQALLAVVFLAALGIGGWYAVQYGSIAPDPSARLLDSLTFSEMVVTGGGAQLKADPDASAATVVSTEDGAVLELLAKRGDFYKARHKTQGVEGWVPVDQVMPMYLLGGGDVMKEYDPLYNPDRYLQVASGSWMQLPEQREESVTVFQFLLRNDSGYDMTDVVMVARIKDTKGHELETVEFAVEGIVPANSSTMVGTLVDPEADARRFITQTTFDTMATEDPELRLEYNDGVEVSMETEDFNAADIDIVELRAIPKGE